MGIAKSSTLKTKLQFRPNSLMPIELRFAFHFAKRSFGFVKFPYRELLTLAFLSASLMILRLNLNPMKMIGITIVERQSFSFIELDFAAVTRCFC